MGSEAQRIVVGESGAVRVDEGARAEERPRRRGQRHGAQSEPRAGRVEARDRAPRGEVMIALTTLLLMGAVGDVEVSRASPKHPRVVLAPRATPDATLRIVFTVGAADDETDAGKTRIAQH